MIEKVDNYLDEWKLKHFPPIPRDDNWYKLKWRKCAPGEPMNLLQNTKGCEIIVEQFGIIGWLSKRKNNTDPDKNEYYYDCPLIEARETGTGRFKEWLLNVKHLVENEFNSRLALSSITNGHLYKYCMECRVSVAIKDVLYEVKLQGK